MVFVVDKVTLGPVSPWVLSHSPLPFILRMLHIILSCFWILATFENLEFTPAALSAKTKLTFSSPSRPNYWSKQTRCYFRKINNPLFTGYDNDLHIMLIFWLPKPVRYASVCSLQSAGEAQGGADGCQTDTWHIGAELRGSVWPERRSRTSSHFRWTIPSHAGTT